MQQHLAEAFLGTEVSMILTLPICWCMIVSSGTENDGGPKQISCCQTIYHTNLPWSSVTSLLKSCQTAIHVSAPPHACDCNAGWAEKCCIYAGEWTSNRIEAWDAFVVVGAGRVSS